VAAVLQRYQQTSADTNATMPYGIILGSAVNQAGRSSGLTAPNGPSQSALISTAPAVAGVSSSDVRFVSVHGTGTALGDPIEVGALASALPAHAQQPFGSGSSPLTLASNKSCYGHTEGAAGLTGLLLAACMAGHQQAPAIMHLRSINPYVAAALADWSAHGSKPLHLPLQLASGALFGHQSDVAGTSSFGMSGVNAHMLVRAAPRASESAASNFVSLKPDVCQVLLLYGLGTCSPRCFSSAMQVAVPFERMRYACAPAVHPLLLQAHKSDGGSSAIQCSLAHAAAGYLWDHQVSHSLQHTLHTSRYHLYSTYLT